MGSLDVVVDEIGVEVLPHFVGTLVEIHYDKGDLDASLSGFVYAAFMFVSLLFVGFLQALDEDPGRCTSAHAAYLVE